MMKIVFFFSSRRRHTRCSRDWSSDVCSSDLAGDPRASGRAAGGLRAGASVALEQAPEVAVQPLTRPATGWPSRSEERRVGKECRSQCAMYHEMKTELCQVSINHISNNMINLN